MFAGIIILGIMFMCVAVVFTAYKSTT